MSQFDFGTIDPNVKTGTQLASDLNQWRTALHSSHGGAVRPAYAIPGMIWVEQISPTSWNLKMATASGDVPIANINPTTNIALTRFPDGALASPAISWVNEPASGFYRQGAASFQFAIGGAAVMGLTPTQATIIPQLLCTDNVIAKGFTSNQGPNVNPTIPGTATFFFNGFVVTGDAVEYGSPTIRIRNAASAPVIVYKFTPNPGTNAGFHELSALPGAGSLRFMGGGLNTGNAGAGYEARNANVGFAGHDLVVIKALAGSEFAEHRFFWRHNGVYNTAGDIVMGNSNINFPQLRLNNAGWSATLAGGNAAQAGLVIETPTHVAAICLRTQGANFIMASTINTMLWGADSNSGPISGYAMQLTNAGAASAAAFTPISDIALKRDIGPIKGALAAMLKLKGIRYCQQWDGAASMGLSAQDVEAVFPELVGQVHAPHVDTTTPAPAPLKTLNYNGLIGPIIESLRELHARIVTLEQK